MYSVKITSKISKCFAVAAVLGCVTTIATPAEARCYQFRASHNGTDLFNWDGGAKTAATKKLMYSIDQWKQKRRIKRVRIGKVTTRCGPWNIDYILPHHRCYAKARVCY